MKTFKYAVLISIIALILGNRAIAQTNTSTAGYYPSSPLLLASDNNYYGENALGGQFGYGTIFQITPAGAVNIIYSFHGSTDGASPGGGLIQNPSDGFLYGTTSQGGSGGDGTIFKITTASTLTTLHSFTGTDGAYNPTSPSTPLLLANNGNLYGTTMLGGANNYGTVFEITTQGVLTTLLSFNGTNGSLPESRLTQGSTGLLYGTTYQGGAHSEGTLYSVSTSGTLTTLVSFSSPNGYPLAGVIQASNGLLYGTTYLGNPNQNTGTIYRCTTSGSSFATLVAFSLNGNNGIHPTSDLLQASDQNIYGTTSSTAFKMTLGGSLSTLATFSQEAGGGVISSLIEVGSIAGGGYLQGTTTFGGTSYLDNPTAYGGSPAQYGGMGYGTVFEVNSSALNTLVSFFTAPAAKPSLQITPIGSSATLSIISYGSPILSYQWQQNGSAIPGATTSSYTIPSVSAANANTTYSVVVTYSYGSATSNSLQIIPVSTGLTSQTVAPGQSATFSITPVGSGPFSYQWLFAGLPIAGATSSTLTIPNASSANQGYYSVEITAPAGSATTTPVYLTVAAPPTPVSEPTMPQWMLMLLAVILCVAAIYSKEFQTH